MKKLENVISMIILFIIIGIVSIVIYERHYNTKFSNTELQISYTTFKKKWGDPNQITSHSNGKKIIVYKTLFSKFIFTLNENEIVEFKNSDFR